MQRDLSIIRADASHLEMLVPLFDAYRVFYGQQPDEERARRYVRARLADGEASVFFLALESDRAVGFTRIFGSFSSINTKRLWILEDLYVAPAARNNGIARALMERAKGHARETDSVGLALETAVDNVSAQSLYESLGYERDRAFFRYNLVL